MVDMYFYEIGTGLEHADEEDAKKKKASDETTHDGPQEEGEKNADADGAMRFRKVASSTYKFIKKKKPEIIAGAYVANRMYRRHQVRKHPLSGAFAEGVRYRGV